MIAPWRVLARLRRAEQALRWIGTDCSNRTRGRCMNDREPDAEFTADKWCDECLAAYGLGVDEPLVPLR